MLQDGPRGLAERMDAEDVDLARYGVDWEALEDEQLMHHHAMHNDAEPEYNPFTGPPQLSEVICEGPDSPLTADQVVWLDTQLRLRVNTGSRNMHVRRQVWIEAYKMCNILFVSNQ